MPEVTNILQPKQQEVLDTILSNPDLEDICLEGSSRSGKTFLVADYCHNRAVAYPGSAQLFVRSTLTALTTGVVSQTFPNVFKAYQKQSGINLTEVKTDTGKKFVEHRSQPYNRFTYFNGSEIRFFGLDTVTTDPTALDKVLSQEYITIVIEEAPEMDYKAVEILKTRLAQKVAHWITGKPAVPKLIATLNPRLFEDWDYVYFHEKKSPQDDTPLRHPEKITSVHFHITDNLANVNDSFLERLEGLSTANRQRFLAGKHSDSFEGEVFKKLHWDELPPILEFEAMIIYTDPSYKSGPKNDYKASVAVGLRKGAFWIIDCKAMQTTTSQMILNVHDIYHALVARGWNRPIQIYFENAGMPDDFIPAIQSHAETHKWVCPYQLDGRDKGDKYARIESILEPLNNLGKLFINNDIKGTKIGNLLTVQFLNFRKHLLSTEHDDIPDAVHGAVTMINIPVIKPGQVTHIKRTMNSIG
jgi:hypothetical protein